MTILFQNICFYTIIGILLIVSVWTISYEKFILQPSAIKIFSSLLCPRENYELNQRHDHQNYHHGEIFSFLVFFFFPFMSVIFNFRICSLDLLKTISIILWDKIGII